MTAHRSSGAVTSTTASPSRTRVPGAGSSSASSVTVARKRASRGEGTAYPLAQRLAEATQGARGDDRDRVGIDDVAALGAGEDDLAPEHVGEDGVECGVLHPDPCATPPVVGSRYAVGGVSRRRLGRVPVEGRHGQAAVERAHGERQQARVLDGAQDTRRGPVDEAPGAVADRAVRRRARSRSGRGGGCP